MLALLYDVHGNLPALEAVLEDAQAAGADRWLLGGDYAAFGGWPAGAVERLMQLNDAVWIRGNTERWLADDSELAAGAPQRPALAAARAALGEEDVRWLSGLREDVTLAEGVFCHASPLNDMLLAGAKGPRIVFGHTHVQFARVRPDDTELVNPGSVGLPLDGDPRAAYALIENDTVELRRVAYDHEAAARRAGEVSGELFAERILRAAP
jgi:predicted phosphodiesterase